MKLKLTIPIILLVCGIIYVSCDSSTGTKGVRVTNELNTRIEASIKVISPTFKYEDDGIKNTKQLLKKYRDQGVFEPAITLCYVRKMTWDKKRELSDFILTVIGLQEKISATHIKIENKGTGDVVRYFIERDELKHNKKQSKKYVFFQYRDMFDLNSSIGSYLSDNSFLKNATVSLMDGDKEVASIKGISYYEEDHTENK